jgi:hypothetical protein
MRVLCAPTGSFHFFHLGFCGACACELRRVVLHVIDKLGMVGFVLGDFGCGGDQSVSKQGIE